VSAAGLNKILLPFFVGQIKYEISACFYEDTYYSSQTKIAPKAACDPENCFESRL
jgi:hypothetical protein